jgi:hypothetical protein
MRQARRVTSLTICLVVALTAAIGSVPARSHTGNLIYPLYELPTGDLPDLQDQTIADWENVLPNASLTHNDFVRSSGDEAIDPENLAWRVFLAWHHASQRIYMAVERLDDDYWPRAEGGAGEPSYLYIDGDHSGGRFRGFDPELPENELKRLESSRAQMYTMNSEPTPTSNDLIWVGGPAKDWASRPPWTDAGGFEFGETPNISGVEVAATAWDDLHWQGPALSTRSSLQPGAIIGFMVDIWDIDRDDRYLQMFSLSRVSRHTTPVSTTAEDFVDGELIPCYTSDCSSKRRSAVAVDSWGRIKAGIR